MSRVWADDRGRNRLGDVMAQDEVVYSGREVQKGDAHPGGYQATVGYGGILGSMTSGPFITYVPTRKPGIAASIDMLQEKYPLAGIVAKGLAPYATLSVSQDQALLRAVYRGVPVVKTARQRERSSAVTPENLFIEGNNLTATKARLLLTAAIMKLGAPPPVADPERPTREELDAIRRRIAAYQEIFQTH